MITNDEWIGSIMNGAIKNLFINSSAFIKNNSNLKMENSLSMSFCILPTQMIQTFFWNIMPQQNITCKLFNSFNIKAKYRKKWDLKNWLPKRGNRSRLWSKFTNDTVKKLRLQFSYTKKVQFQHNFLQFVIKLEQVIYLWNNRNLTLKGRILVLKIAAKDLAISRIVYVTLMTVTLMTMVDELQQEIASLQSSLQKAFYNKRFSCT